jgi:hypothetical protein
MWIAGFSIVLSLVVAPSPADAWPCGPDDLSPRAPLYYLNHCERPFADILAEFSRDTGYPITGRMPSGTVTLDCASRGDAVRLGVDASEIESRRSAFSKTRLWLTLG